MKCGRIYQRWTNGSKEWIEDPTVKECKKIYREGVVHFRDIHKEIARLRSMIKDVRSHTPGWKRAQKRKAARRKAREAAE